MTHELSLLLCLYTKNGPSQNDTPHHHHQPQQQEQAWFLTRALTQIYSGLTYTTNTDPTETDHDSSSDTDSTDEYRSTTPRQVAFRTEDRVRESAMTTTSVVSTLEGGGGGGGGNGMRSDVTAASMTTAMTSAPSTVGDESEEDHGGADSDTSWSPHDNDHETTATPSDNNNNNNHNNNSENNNNNDNDNDNNNHHHKPPLSKSNRLKGYLFLLLFSIINVNSAIESTRNSFDETKTPHPPSSSQRGYAMTVAFITIMITGFVVLVHFDRFTCLQSYWYKAFQPNSKIELILLLLLILWWSLATWINTTVTGIAGEGKIQFNLYFSTWGACITCFWTIERWRTAAGQISTKHFLRDMPARSADWTKAFVCNVLSFSFLVNLQNNVVEVAGGVPVLHALYVVDAPPTYQWVLVGLVSFCSFALAVVFVAFELFRKEQKGDIENLIEGVFLLVLSLLWIPVVTIVTVPGGVVQLVGNAYFWTWAACGTVMQTFAKWIIDWRRKIHVQIESQLIEYEMAKRAVLRLESQKDRKKKKGENEKANKKALGGGDLSMGRGRGLRYANSVVTDTSMTVGGD